MWTMINLLFIGFAHNSKDGTQYPSTSPPVLYYYILEAIMIKKNDFRKTRCYFLLQPHNARGSKCLRALEAPGCIASAHKEFALLLIDESY